MLERIICLGKDTFLSTGRAFMAFWYYAVYKQCYVYEGMLTTVRDIQFVIPVQAIWRCVEAGCHLPMQKYWYAVSTGGMFVANH